MKKKSFFLSSVLFFVLTISMVTLLSSCSDSDDVTISPAIPLADDTFVDNAMMDRSVKPGDSFWEYAIGTWLKTHSEDDAGLCDNVSDELGKELLLQFIFSDDPLVVHINKLAEDVDTDETAFSQMISLMANMGIISSEEGIESSEFDALTRAQFVERLSTMINGGFSSLVSRTVSTDKGVFIRVLTAGKYSKGLKEVVDASESQAVATVEQLLEKLKSNDNYDDLEAVAKKIVAIEKKVISCQNPLYSDDLRLRQHAIAKRPVPASQMGARSRGADGVSAADVYKALGVDDADASVDEMVVPIVDIILNEDIETLCYYLCFCIMNQFDPLVPDDEDEDYNIQSNLYQLLVSAAPELLCKIEYPLLATKGDTEGCRTIMEQMRTIMDQRIAALDWMSDATKSEARKKLAAMKFNIGVPATCPGGSLKLSGETLFEDVQQLMQQRQASLMALTGKSIDYSWDLLIQCINLGLFNAMYLPNLNQLFILPGFICEEVFPKDDEPMRYATSFVFGHEMCHGFDDFGAQYDGQGTVSDWWSPADKSQFEKRQQQMVELYNQLWQYTGVHADGKKTLGENMADLGGIRLAFELYTQKLKADGLDAQAIAHQQREFFLHYAKLWQCDKNESELEEQLKGDEHSAAHNRIIGITRLMDEWYDLFEVTDGQWYLSPDKRVKIW